MASDGKIVIDVLLDDGTVAKGVANIDKKLGGISGAGRKAAAGIKEMVTALGLVALASKAIDAVKNSLDGAIARYDTLKSFPVVMQQMGFSAEQAQSSINKLSEGIDGLPTTLDSIVASTQRIALMTGDLDLATDTAIALNNAFLASGSSAFDAERGLTQYVQMLSKGKVDGQSWITLQETMGYALNKTAEAFGFTSDAAQNELYEALKSGTVTFDEFNAKIIELNDGIDGFAVIAKDSTNGIATSFSNMRNAVVKGVANVIDAIDQALGGTGKIAGYLDGLKDGINNVFNWIVATIPVIASAIRSVKEALDPWIPTIENIGNAVENVFTNILGQVFENAKTIISTYVDFWKENWDSIVQFNSAIFGGIWNTIQTVFGAIYDIISDILGNKVIPFIQTQLEILEKFWKENGEQITQAVQNAFKVIQAVVEFVMPAIKFVIEIVWSAIKDIIGGALNVIMGLIQVFTSIFTGDWNQLWEGIKKILKGAVDLVLGILTFSFLGGIRTVFANLLKNGVNVVRTMWTSIVNYFKNFSTNAVNTVSNMASRVWTFAKTLSKNFVNTIVKLKNDIIKRFTQIKDDVIKTVKSIDLREVGKDIIKGLINGIGSMASAVVDKAKEIGGNIIKGFKGVFDIHSPSRVMMSIGKYVGQGLAKGIDGTKKENQKVTEELGQILINKTHDYESELAKLRKEYAKAEKGDREKINKEIIKLQEGFEKEKLNAIQEFIKQKKGLEELSLADEVRIWEESLKHFKEGTDEKIEAQIAYKNALKAVNDEIVKINEEYSNKIVEVNENLKQREKELTETYTKAVEDRTKSLTNFVGLFDEFDHKFAASGTKLVKNLESQVEGFKKWQSEIELLSQRAIDEGLLEELRQMGPKALPEIMALNKLTDEELTKYSDLYQEKSELARQQATKELEVMRFETQAQIVALHLQTASQLTKLQLEWQKKIKEVRTGTNEELGEMKSDLKTIGEQSIQGMINGLEAMEPALMRKARSIANAVKREIERALDIRSPSRWMRDHIGKNMGLGWIEGIDSQQRDILKKANQMADWMKPDVPIINRLRGVKPPIGNIFPGTSSNVTNSHSNIKNDHSKHVSVQVQGGSDARQIARQVEKAERRMIFQMG